MRVRIGPYPDDLPAGGAQDVYAPPAILVEMVHAPFFTPSAPAPAFGLSAPKSIILYKHVKNLYLSSSGAAPSPTGRSGAERGGAGRSGAERGGAGRSGPGARHLRPPASVCGPLKASRGATARARRLAPMAASRFFRAPQRGGACPHARPKGRRNAHRWGTCGLGT